VNPSVSVIMPFLDEERFIATAIESVRGQTLADWELLLVDDGSRDGSAAIAEAYAVRDPARIRLVRHADGGTRGPAASRNLGLALAAGEFVAFLDADDRYDADKLETERRILRRMPHVAMLYGPTRWWYPARGHPDRIERPGVPTDTVHRPPRLATAVLLRHRGPVPCTCAVLLRRDVCVAVGGFEPSFRLYEDQTLWAKVFVRHPVFVSARATSTYRQHEGSTSARALRAGEYHPWRMHPAEERFLEWMRAHAAATGIDDRELLQALDHAQAAYRRRHAAALRFVRALGRRAGSRVVATIGRLTGATPASPR
jgi:hypothetical protein